MRHFAKLAFIGGKSILEQYAAPNGSEFLTRRLYTESEEPYIIFRDPFQRDRDRVVHSRAFRRLMHKTQILNANYGDHYRNRLTHTLEVNQIARSLGKALYLNDELIEAIALGHDLGHTPFGHIGERTLHRILMGRMVQEVGCGISEGFKHNYQGLQVVDNFESGARGRTGLNLTLAVREGILKHTKSKMKYYDSISKREFEDNVVYSGLNLDGIIVDRPSSFTLEGQVVAVADEIAQCTHDIEDGIRAKIMSIQDLLEIGMIKKMKKIYHIEDSELRITNDVRTILIRKMISFLIEDAYIASRTNIEKYICKYDLPTFKSERHGFAEQLIMFSKDVNSLVLELSEKKRSIVLSSQVISTEDARAEYVIRQIFKAYYMHPKQLPDYILERHCKRSGHEFNRLALVESDLQNSPVFIRLICDHIAGMTDQFASREYANLYIPESF